MSKKMRIPVSVARDKYNEYLMTNLRTMWGIEWRWLSERYPDWWKLSERRLPAYEAEGWMSREGGRIRLTERGWLVSDRIFSELFV